MEISQIHLSSSRWLRPIAFLFILLLCSPKLQAAASVEEGMAVLSAQLPPGTPIEKVSEPVLLDAVKRAAIAKPNLAPQIAAAAVRAKVGKGAIRTRDGKEVHAVKHDFKGSGAMPTETLIASIAIAAIEGATAEGASPDSLLVDDVMAAVGLELPRDGKGGDPREILARITEMVISKVSPSSLGMLTNLRSQSPYLYTAPPATTLVNVEQLRPSPTPSPTPSRPARRLVTPFTPSVQ